MTARSREQVRDALAGLANAMPATMQPLIRKAPLRRDDQRCRVPAV
jgi:hypothetical protein